MEAPRKYPGELQDRATRMASEALADPDPAHGAIVQITKQLGVHREALPTWARKALTDDVTAGGVTSDRDARLADLEKDNREVHRMNTNLKQASAFFAAELDRPPRCEGSSSTATRRARCPTDPRRAGRNGRKGRALDLLLRQDQASLGTHAA